jgi:hypothetical protein
MTKYDQTTVNLPKETKCKVRIFAAKMGISMGKAALKLIELGLEDYPNCDDTECALKMGENAQKSPPPAA